MERLLRLGKDRAVDRFGRVDGTDREQQAALDVVVEVGHCRGGKLARRRYARLVLGTATLAVGDERQRGGDEGGYGEHRDQCPRPSDRTALERDLVVPTRFLVGALLVAFGDALAQVLMLVR